MLVGLSGLDGIGWIWYSQSRVKRERRFARSKIFIDAQSVPSLLRSLLGGEKTVERPLWACFTYEKDAISYVSTVNIESFLC